MEPEGLFVSNHVTSATTGKTYLTSSIVELMTRSMEYPTHQLTEMDLTNAPAAAGFGAFRTRHLETGLPHHMPLLSAVTTDG